LGEHMAFDLNLINHPICFASPRRLTPISAWHEHVPFAMFLVDILKPNVIVELGTHYGDSYCAFCQAVHELHLSTRCYAVDTWVGDPHSGFYGFDVLPDLQAHHDRLYGSFSKLIQSTFDEALQHFSNGTIDLLHIDGYHSYESVKHDFISWLPKMSQNGIILLHDINVRERNFGVWEFWDELKNQYPHFFFLHGQGLGLLAVGKDYPKSFQELLEAEEEDVIKIRKFFFELGYRLTIKSRFRQQLAQLQDKVQTQHQEITQLQDKVQTQHQEITQLQDKVQTQQQEMARLQDTFDSQQQEIKIIHTSMGWKLLSRYWSLENKLLAPGTRRRKAYDSILLGIKGRLTNTGKGN
jgi:hypothetical protein